MTEPATTIPGCRDLQGDRHDLVAVFVFGGRQGNENHRFKCSTDTNVWRQYHYTGDMTTFREMIDEMRGHGVPVIRDEQKVVPFAPEQDFGVKSTRRRSIGITDPPHDKIRIAKSQLSSVEWR